MEADVRDDASAGGADGRVRMLAVFHRVKRDGHPGLTVVWKGLAQLHDLTLMFQIFRPDS